MKYLLLTLALICVASHAQPVCAQDDEARIHFEAGSLYYSEANYESALSEFRRAYELSDRVELLFNMSQCHERLGQLPDAISTLERYIEGTSDEDNRERQTRRLENLRRRETQQRSDAEATAASEAESARVQAQADAARAAADAAQREADAEDEAAAASGGGGLRTTGFALVGVGGAGLITFAIAGALAASENSRLEDACDWEMGMFCTEDDVSSLRTRSLVADIGLGVGVVAAITGIILIIVGGGESGEDTTALVVSPDIRRAGGGASVQVTF